MTVNELGMRSAMYLHEGEEYEALKTLMRCHITYRETKDELFGIDQQIVTLECSRKVLESLEVDQDTEDGNPIWGAICQAIRMNCSGVTIQTSYAPASIQGMPDWVAELMDKFPEVKSLDVIEAQFVED